MKQLIGLKLFGIHMSSAVFTEIDNNYHLLKSTIEFEKKWYIPRFEQSYNNYYKELNRKLREIITLHVDDLNLHFLASNFITYDTVYEKIGYKCFFYDVDSVIVQYNKLLHERVYDHDVVFDPLTKLQGLLINKWTNSLYPLGKIYKGNFLLCGNDIDRIWYAKKYHSCEEIIEDNLITDVTLTAHIPFEHHNEYIVLGSN